MKKVSVVILNWNGEQMLRQFLPTVVSCSAGEEVEVCVADNASTDASVQWLRNEFPAVRLIVLDRNYGFAEGYNRALEQVDAEYVVLLNSDVEVTPHWLEPLVTFMDAHPEVAACQPKLLDQRKKSFFEYAYCNGETTDDLISYNSYTIEDGQMVIDNYATVNLDNALRGYIPFSQADLQ